MTDYVIAIPSYKRHHILNERTLLYLFNQNIDQDKIHIFVANEEEREIYERYIHKCSYNKMIVIGQSGIGYAREFMANYFPQGQKIMYIDDDLSDILMKVDDKTMKPLENLHSFSEMTFTHLYNHRLGLCGVYPVCNPFFMKKTLSTDLKFCIGQLYWTINDKECEAREYDLMEDFEKTLKYYRHYQGVLRYNYIYPKADYARLGGGCNENYDRSIEGKGEEISRFLQQYPTYVRMKTKKATIDLNFIKQKNIK